MPNARSRYIVREGRTHANGGRTSRRWPAVVSIALLIAVSGAAGAGAQSDVGEDTTLDTVLTPVAKETPAWIQVGGAEHGFDEPPQGSPTPAEADLNTVAFQNDRHGFAGGSECKEPASGKTGQALTDYLATCPREPVIYEYVKTATEESWHPVLPPDGDGYVGAIAFMSGGRALAVGGTGHYPKREAATSAADDLDPSDGDGAGSARAWIYGGNVWSELHEPDMARGMRGLTAVASAPDADDCGGAECGLAGGYRQMWLWKDGAFEDGWDTAPAQADRSPDATRTVRVSPSDASDDGESFRFRVRDVAFVDAGQTTAFAVTSGCCDANVAGNVPAGLVFDGENLYAKEYQAPANVAGPDPVVRGAGPDSLYGFAADGGLASLFNTPGGEADASVGAESSSRVVQGVLLPGPAGTFRPLEDPQNQPVSTMRLMAGTFGWAVGSLGDGRGLAFEVNDRNLSQTTLSAVGANVLKCPGRGWGTLSFTAPDPRCEPYEVPDGYRGQFESKGLLLLPSYGLNAMEFTDDSGSIAWGVGDRGAIVRLGGVGTTGRVGDEPPLAKLGTGTIARLPGSDVYDAFRPLPAEGDTAPVPSLASNGTRRLERPQFVAGGAPNPTIPPHVKYPPEDAASVVMSPDGSEGWAVGTGGDAFTGLSLPVVAGVPTLYHYDGARWSRCDIRGVAGLLPPDPACADLDELFVGQSPIVLLDAVRVPLENDEDPSNDDEFEVFALGSNHPDTRAATPLRYQSGHWSVDDVSLAAFKNLRLAEVRSVAFTSPADGWVASQEGGSVRLKHWDGEDWEDCELAEPRHGECGDPADGLPLGAPGDVSLTTAGKRVYLAANRSVNGTQVPVILYKDPGGTWTSRGGGYDPGCDPAAEGCVQQQPEPEQQGLVRSIAVSPDHRHGWAVGEFGSEAPVSGVNLETPADDAAGPRYYLLRLDGGVWTPYREDDAASDYLARQQSARRPTPVMLDPQTGTAAIYMTDPAGSTGPPVLLFEPGRGRWRVLRMPFATDSVHESNSAGLVRSFAPDGQGGAWLVAKPNKSSGERQAVYFWHYTDEVPNEVFEEAPHPIREQITGSAAGADGSFWVTTNSAFIYRYDRLTGWDRLRIPGWDPGRVITRGSEANAVAVAPDGEGLAVGKNGRIAQVSPLGVRLDPAAGEVSGRDLRAVDVAPDGSALVGGDASVLLYKSPGGEFRRIDFGGSPNTSITAISMPTGDRAWLTNAVGQVYAGQRVGDKWSFSVENLSPSGDLLSRDENQALLKLNGIDIDRDGEGYAVGARGLILERRGDAGWQRLKTGFMDTLRSVALAPGGRDRGALIGGDVGLVLTLEGNEFRVAREADLFNPLNYGRAPSDAAAVRGVAMIPGIDSGEVEAWAVQQSRTGPGAVLHYASDADDPLMRPGGRAAPLPDTPDPRPGEISFAAFGRSECHVAINDKCGEGGAGDLFHEIVADRVAREVIERGKEPGGPDFAVFTGEVGRAAGRDLQPGAATVGSTPLDKSWVHRRWQELVANQFADAGMPLFGAVGRNDLDRTSACVGATTCLADANTLTGAGLTWGWRRAMAAMPQPWGNSPEPVERAGLSFKPVPASGTDDPVLSTVQESQARTHYAVDVLRGSDAIARLIVLDNSMRTLQSSDPNQNPIEPDGQLQWLDRMLSGVDREHGQQAIVVMNYPTYSYQVADATTWAGDASLVEQTLLRHRVKMVVSGRLGWNGRYWTTAAGLHHPCPGDSYMSDLDAPEPGEAPTCGQQAPTTDPIDQATEQLAKALQGLGPPPAPGGGDPAPIPGVDVPTDRVEDIVSDAGLQGLIPMVVASSAGGRFGPNGTDGGEAGNGWWHGYTVVRMDASGDPRATIVEQRPVFDWISITAPSHLLKPRQRMRLIGEGREPIGVDVSPRYDLINSQAITHRYDLVLADKENPSIPARQANGQYIPLPDNKDCAVGCIDDAGVVTAGTGRHERVYAVALLSVGDKAASWPIAFEPAKSYKPAAVATVTPSAPPNPAPQPPATVVLNQGPAPASPPPPPPGLPPINVPPLNLPPPPAPPQLPIPTATPTPTPPPPPVPPPPPGNAGALPLSLEAPLTPVSIVPTVIPPSPPPVNPAPPSGSAARKEARQRQAATAKSEEGGGDQQGAGEGQSSGDNGAAQMTRRDPTRPAPSYGESSRDDRRYSFTAMSHGEQASAWSGGALYGGMTLATALALALGWGIARPTPRRRHPPRPAPETVRDVGRRPRN